jgi:hypothetical protein
VIAEHHRQVEFDFACRGWDLLDFWRGDMTLRALSVRVDGLREDTTSATWRAAVGGPHESERDILADIADILASANWQRSGDKDAPRPPAHPRPGDDRRRKELDNKMGARARAMKARLQRHQDGG